MKRVLFVYPWQDLFSGGSGAAWRASNSVAALASKCTVDIVSFSESHASDERFNWHIAANESRFHDLPDESNEELSLIHI